MSTGKLPGKLYIRYIGTNVNAWYVYRIKKGRKQVLVYHWAYSRWKETDFDRGDLVSGAFSFSRFSLLLLAYTGIPTDGFTKLLR